MTFCIHIFLYNFSLKRYVSFLLIYVHISFVLLCVRFKEMQHVGYSATPAAIQRKCIKLSSTVVGMMKQKVIKVLHGIIVMDYNEKLFLLIFIV